MSTRKRSPFRSPSSSCRSCAARRAQTAHAVEAARISGTPASAAEIARWDISIPPSGAGLPPAAARARQGAAGLRAEVPRLPRREGRGQAGRPARRRGRHARDARRRCAPSAATGRTRRRSSTTCAARCRSPARMSLTNDEVYAVTAYLLAPQRHHRRGRGDERADPAAGEDAEPRRLRLRLAAAGALNRSQQGAGGASASFGSIARSAFGQVSFAKSTGCVVSPAPCAHFDRLQKSLVVDPVERDRPDVGLPLVARRALRGCRPSRRRRRPL